MFYDIYICLKCYIKIFVRIDIDDYVQLSILLWFRNFYGYLIEVILDKVNICIIKLSCNFMNNLNGFYLVSLRCEQFNIFKYFFF